jgi:hypothetical protein
MAPTKKYKTYSEKRLKLAVRSVKDGERTLRNASKVFQVPKDTISRWKSGVNTGVRKKSVLDSDEEQYLKGHMFRCAKLGVAFNNKMLIESALHIIWSRKDPAERNA